jgi:hypothetical protein
LVQPACSQPDADTIVHEHLHPVGAAVGEQVGVVRLCLPKACTTRAKTVPCPRAYPAAPSPATQPRYRSLEPLTQPACASACPFQWPAHHNGA